MINFIDLGREVVFQCRDEGTLRAKVGWRRGNGLQLPPGSRNLEGRLEMPNIQVKYLYKLIYTYTQLDGIY